MTFRHFATAEALVLVIMAASAGWSQESRGTILGRLTDTSGAVVPAGSLQVTNVATGVTLKGVTNEEGNYYFPFLIPGLYRISAEKAGSRAGKAEFTLDGPSNTIHDQARGSIAAAWAPPSDTVAEFKIQTAVFDATTGQTEGGVVNISLKSGTNKLHGSAYWGKQTPSMNANTWFSNLNGQPRGDFKYNRF